MRTPPPHIGVVGLGLIGTSVALGREARVACGRLTGIDRPGA